MSTHRKELLELLDRLCEGRLSAAEHARLDTLVSGDDEALRLYIDYITLHGTLQWDTALSEDVPAPVMQTIAPPVAAGQSRHRRLWSTVAACLVIAGGTLALLSPPGGDPVAEGPQQPGDIERTPLVADNDAPG